MGICLIFSFLVAHSQRELINQVSCSSKLFVFDVIIVNFLQVILADISNASFQFSGFLVFSPVVLSLEFRVCSQEDILIGGGGTYAIVFVGAKPSRIFFAVNRAPTMARDMAFWNGGIFSQIQSDFLWLDPRFQASCFRMLSSSLEKSRRLNLIAIDLLNSPINYSIPIKLIQLIS